jgi:hypothetical protein
VSERAPYSRVYWTIRNDDRLKAVYPDDRLLATWLRLLIAADMAWPAPADLPRAANAKAVAALEAAGVITTVGHLFTFHGLDAERGRRTDAAASSAHARWGSSRDADASGSHPKRSADASGSQSERYASRAEPSRDEPSTPARAREDANGGDDDPASAYWTLSGRYPSTDARKWLDDLSAEYGSEAVAAQLAEVWAGGPKNGAIGRCQDALKAAERAQTRSKPKVGLQPGTAEYEFAQFLAAEEVKP